jgi:hypothetical protein
MPSHLNERTEKLARAAIEEARMVLPGMQALFGFQLIAVFNERFRQLPEFDQALHFLAVILIAIAIALIMTPAAYHRQTEQDTVSEFFLKLTSWLIAIAMLPLMAALCLEIYLLGILIIVDPAPSAAIAGALLVVFAGLWFAFPWLARRRNGHARLARRERQGHEPDAA